MTASKPIYRPTVHYAYHPCDDAVLSVRELQMHNFKMQKKVRLMGKEIVAGMDELGALLMGDFGALWYGSQLTIQEARQHPRRPVQRDVAADRLAGAGRRDPT